MFLTFSGYNYILAPYPKLDGLIPFESHDTLSKCKVVLSLPTPHPPSTPVNVSLKMSHKNELSPWVFEVVALLAILEAGAEGLKVFRYIKK